jgi:D-aminoacyl-tRNA deacylase
VRAVVQRVSRAKVTVDGDVTGQIGRGVLILLGVTHDDAEADADQLIDKIAGLRILADENGKMNVSLRDAGGSMLVVSQFTLFADTSRGRRPSYLGAAGGELANRLYRYFIEVAGSSGIDVAEGRFGAMMDVELVNDGPVTIILDTKA